MHRPLDTSPPVYRYMKDALDRSVFQKSIPVLAVRVPARKTTTFLKSDLLKSYIMDIPKIRSVQWDPFGENDRRLVLLNVSEEDQSAELVGHKIELHYDYWTADDILQSILPEELLVGSPTGFSVTGHIAHMNLNREYLPYKKIIGQVILDKNPAIKTVVNKLDNIDNKFRFFKMELLAGEPNFVVEHHESNCRFLFDFSKVYWNSRLHTEHDRLVQQFNPEDVVADVFAGVGPFAIPAARKGCAVLANDLNPDSAHYLSKNIAINNVNDLVRASCEDGRDFIRNAVIRTIQNPFLPYSGPKLSRVKEKQLRRNIQTREQSTVHPTTEGFHSISTFPRKMVTQFVMNLPDSALEFLDAFRGILIAPGDTQAEICGIYTEMPLIHCYCFTRELEPHKAEVDIRQVGKGYLWRPSLTTHCDAEDNSSSLATSALKTVRNVVSAPESELKRWRRVFDANAKVIVNGEKFLDPENFVNAIAPRGDLTKIGRAQFAILFRVADASKRGLVSWEDFTVFETMLKRPDADYWIAFQYFDVDNSGTITFDEFKNVFTANVSTPVVPFDFDCDWVKLYLGKKNGTHVLGYNEFTQLMKGLQGERVRQAFKHLDTDQDGFIRPDQFKQIILEIAGHKLSDAVVERLPTLCTLTPGGRISYSEVVAFHNVVKGE
ncbi:hypothetical protein ID866_3624 [Astraeus odoratus]|nr:hypothetical protein ID866_3624 [Astraeus odoratus]